MDLPSSADAKGSDAVAMKALAQQAIRIFELETDNDSLRAQLEALRPDLDEPLRTVSTEKDDTLINKYNELAKSFRELESRHAKCKPYIEEVVKKYKEAKDVARQWKVYHDRKMAEKMKVQAIHVPTGDGRADSPSGDAREDELPDIDGEVTPRPLRTAPEEVLDHAVGITALPIRLAEYQGLGDQQVEPGPSSSRTLRLSSSQTTDPGSDPMDVNSSPPRKHEPSSDSEPLVVSARTLKRKLSAPAMPPAVRIKQELNSPEKPIEIKSEDYSSPVQKRQHLVRQEISDLDAFADDYTTPRKHRARHRAVSEEVSKRPALITRVSSLSEGDIPEPEDPYTSVTSHHDPAVAGAGGHRAMSTQGFHDEHTSSRTVDKALRPLSVNVPPKRRPARRSDGDTAAKVAMLSEDGEVDIPQHKRAKVLKEDGKGTPKAHASRRLDTMLDEPTPDTRQLVRDHTPQPVAPRTRRPLTPVSEPKPASKHPEKASLKKRGQPATDTAPRYKPHAKALSPQKRAEHRFDRRVENSPPLVRPEDEPLRFKPLSALRLEDFKVNPKYMGADFAFVDTLRGRDQRRCMQGCNKPECCGGAFLKAVELAGNEGSSKSDAEVLEAYLGPNWQQMVGAYPRDKRDALLQQARAASFANQYGKHRHAFERHSTPPGFWRTDMPTTQEAAEDRVKANAMVRQKVEERWREAMRDGDGRWLFRDE